MPTLAKRQTTNNAGQLIWGQLATRGLLRGGAPVGWKSASVTRIQYLHAEQAPPDQFRAAQANLSPHKDELGKDATQYTADLMQAASFIEANHRRRLMIWIDVAAWPLFVVLVVVVCVAKHSSSSGMTYDESEQSLVC